MTWLKELFGTEKAAIGMVHVPPLPGSPGCPDGPEGMEQAVERARADARALEAAGFDAVMFCNEHDRPYRLKVGPETVAAMAAVVARVAPELKVPFGVDVLWDPLAALSVARATGARFVREVMTGAYVSDFGLWETSIGEVARFRHQIGADEVRLLANINAEFASPLDRRPTEEVARSVVFSSQVDAVCLSGEMTGRPVPVDLLRRVKEVVPETVVIANTGVNVENVAAMLEHADAVIVGTSVKVDGITWNPVDPARAQRLMDAVRRLRGQR